MDDLPPFVVIGQWVDVEYRDLCSRTNSPATSEEIRRILAGPRQHPYGVEAHALIRDSEVVVYPNAKAAEASNE